MTLVANCQSQREGRVGIDLVDDDVDDALHEVRDEGSCQRLSRRSWEAAGA